MARKFLSFSKIAAGLCLAVIVFYGAGRLYYVLTDGFTVENIYTDKDNDPKWALPFPTHYKEEELKILFSQPFDYLGKGCQSYVFSSRDGKYVLKFLKYQRYRSKDWLAKYDFVPFVKNYRVKRSEHKKRKIENVYLSWMTSFIGVPEETATVWIHLNKGPIFKNRQKTTVTIYDKTGKPHRICLDDHEFMVQKRAKMIEPYLVELIETNRLPKAKAFLNKMVETIVLEFRKGFTDNDYALMQNTGVLNDKAIHIDVGQIIFNEKVKNPDIYRKELFNKTYKFRAWLKNASPELANFFDQKLESIIGPEFHTYPPYYSKSNIGELKNEADLLLGKKTNY